jgi:hypothetical protein
MPRPTLEQKPEAPVTLADLDACLDALAALIGMGEEQYTPLFERLEVEFAALRETETVGGRIAIRLARQDSPARPGQTAVRSASAVQAYTPAIHQSRIQAG